MTLRNPIIFETTYSEYNASDIVGEGGSGRIYKAIDESGNNYAIKLLDPAKATKEKRQRFKNELQFCLRNEHKNIVTVIDHGILKQSIGTSPFYVMPFYQKSLRDILSQGIERSKILVCFAQILDGVEAAHLQKVIHRDLKPENILYDSNKENLLIADFGIARFEEEDLFTAVETKDTVRLANFQYAAPEQRDRNREVDHHADIYALALILNEMFTGEVPYGTDYKTIGSVDNDYEYLDDLVSEMLRRNPSERPESIEIIKAQLIGKRNEFVTQQRISELRQTVITENEIDDPLINDPPRLVKFDYEDGKLVLILNRPVNSKWIWAYQNMPEFAFSSKHPHDVSFHGEKAIIISADENKIQDIIDHFKKWLLTANSKYEETVRKEIAEEASNKRRKIQQEIERQEQRKRILKNVKI